MGEHEEMYLYEVRLSDPDTGEVEYSWLELPDDEMEDSSIWENEDVEIIIVWA